MSPSFPPPDPFETLGMEPSGGPRLIVPAAVYVGGRPTRETERISQRILDLRPGALVVLTPRVRHEPPAAQG